MKVRATNVAPEPAEVVGVLALAAVGCLGVVACVLFSFAICGGLAALGIWAANTLFGLGVPLTLKSVTAVAALLFIALAVLRR